MRTTTADIAELYEEHDETMFDFPSFINGIREHVDRIAHVCSLIHRIDPVSLLDIGCNKGLFGALARWGDRKLKVVSGVDISSRSCVMAHRMGYDFVYNYNAAEPFDLQQEFDLVLCMEILEHVPDMRVVIQNVRHHLKPNAVAIFSVPSEQGDVDGEFHVRHVYPRDFHRLVAEELRIRDTHFLPSEFCEKPRWQGWHYVVASRRD